MILEEIDPEKELAYIQSKMGKAPRKFGWFEYQFKLKCAKPKWDWEGDDIGIIFDNWKKVFQEGKLGWGNIIQVNNYLFEKGNDNHPGDILVCTKNTDIEQLREDASTLFSVKGDSESIEDPELKEYAEALEGEWARQFGCKVPRIISTNENYFTSIIYFERKHMLGGYLRNGLFPVLFLESDPQVVVAVPHFYWSDFLKKWWLEE